MVHNAVDTARFSPALKAEHRGRVRAELGLPPEALVGIFVGTGWQRKGLYSFIEALGLLARRRENVYGIVGRQGA